MLLNQKFSVAHYFYTYSVLKQGLACIHICVMGSNKAGTHAYGSRRFITSCVWDYAHLSDTYVDLCG